MCVQEVNIVRSSLCSGCAGDEEEEPAGPGEARPPVTTRIARRSRRVRQPAVRGGGPARPALNYEGCELLLIAAADDVEEELEGEVGLGEGCEQEKEGQGARTW
jgi:hypothetical protein